MTVFCNEGRWDKSNVEFSKGKIINYDKTKSSRAMKYIDYGLGILTKNAFDNFNEDAFDLDKVYKYLLSKKQLLGYEVKERFYEIGSFNGLEETSEYLKMKN